jgi:type II secretory pathway component GspD/PulD (secretin)
LVLLRDRASKSVAAKELLEQLLGHRATVTIEIEVLSRSRTFSQTLGVSPPTSFQLAFLGLPKWMKAEISPDVGAYLTLAGGYTLWGIGIGNASIIATMARSLGHQRQRVEITSVDGQPASFLAGERYPIMTAGYFGETPDVGQVYTPPPTFQFEDLGLTIKVTPRVHAHDDVTLELDAEFKTLAGAALNGIPVISARKYQTRLRVGTGEWAVIGGLVNQNDSKTRSGYPFLAELPWIGRLFGTAGRTEEATELLVLLKPHVTSVLPSDDPQPAFWVGTESRPLTIY